MIRSFSAVRAVLCAAAALAMLAPAPRASAQVVFDSFGPGDSFNGGIGWTIQGPNRNPGQTVGFQFTSSGAGQLSGIDIAMGHVDDVNHFDLALYADSGGGLGTLLESWSIDNQMNSFGGAPVFVASVLNPALAMGANYWLVSSTTGNTWAAWHFNNQGITLPMMAGPSGGQLNNIGENTAGAFRVSVTPSAVPEPGSMALLLGGGAGCLFMIRRRRA